MTQISGTAVTFCDLARSRTDGTQAPRHTPKRTDRVSCACRRHGCAPSCSAGRGGLRRSPWCVWHACEADDGLGRWLLVPVQLRIVAASIEARVATGCGPRLIQMCVLVLMAAASWSPIDVPACCRRHCSVCSAAQTFQSLEGQHRPAARSEAPLCFAQRALLPASRCYRTGHRPCRADRSIFGSSARMLAPVASNFSILVAHVADAHV